MAATCTLQPANHTPTDTPPRNIPVAGMARSYQGKRRVNAWFVERPMAATGGAGSPQPRVAVMNRSCRMPVRIGGLPRAGRTARAPRRGRRAVW